MKVFLPKHGGYQSLLSYRKAEAVHDATTYFCAAFIDRRSPAHDRMVRSARSGKQNIVEGSMASATSKEIEIKLMNVARAGLEELLDDYRDYLRVNDLLLWGKEHPEAMRIRRLKDIFNGSHRSYTTYKSYIEGQRPEVAANVIICVIRQACDLLDQQIRQLEKAFLVDGGLPERVTRVRAEARAKAGG